MESVYSEALPPILIQPSDGEKFAEFNGEFFFQIQENCGDNTRKLHAWRLQAKGK